MKESQFPRNTLLKSSFWYSFVKSSPNLFSMEGMKKTYGVVILIQAIYAGMHLLSKAALDGGMNNFIFIFYRQVAATTFLVPLALFLEW